MFNTTNKQFISHLQIAIKCRQPLVERNAYNRKLFNQKPKSVVVVLKDGSFKFSRVFPLKISDTSCNIIQKN